MVPIRYIAALLFFWQLYFCNPALIKIQLITLILCLPQIFRKPFQNLIGFQARRIRIQLGPVSVVFLFFSYWRSTIGVLSLVILGLLILGFGVLYIPQKETQKYQQNKKMHGMAMRSVFVGLVFLTIMESIKGWSIDISPHLLTMSSI